MPVTDSNVTVNGSLSLQISSVMKGLANLITVSGPLAVNINQSFTTGSSAGEVDVEYTESNTLQASTPISVNFFGDSTRFDPLGQPLNLARIKILVIQNNNTPGTGGNITVGGVNSNSQFASMYNTASAAVLLPPGAGVCFWDLDATGYTLGTSSSAASLTLNPGTTTASYSLWSLGCRE